MRRFAFLALASFLVLACVSSSSTPAPHVPVLELQRATVALVTPETDELPSRVYCSGVWVGPNEILTASHCVVEDEAVEPIVFFRTPDSLAFPSSVLRFDLDEDLALLYAPVAPPHTTPSIALASPALGDEVDIMGHPAAITWTLARGWVSAYRDGAMQLSAPVFFGNSGGGAFDRWGDLVGISRSLASVRMGGQRMLVPDVGFFATVPAIRAFLALSR